MIAGGKGCYRQLSFPGLGHAPVGATSGFAVTQARSFRAKRRATPSIQRTYQGDRSLVAVSTLPLLLGAPEGSCLR